MVIKMNDETLKKKLMEGKSWEEFCDTIKMAGYLILKNSPDDPLTRAEGFRYLSRLTRIALEAFLEYDDPLAPVLFRPVHETVKMGADNPDNFYQWASISGNYEYILKGNRGTVHYLGIGTYTGHYGTSGSMGETGYLEAKDIEIKKDGWFEIIISTKEYPKNWLRMEPETTSLIVRQTFLDKAKEVPANLTIERIGGEKGRRGLTPEFIASGLSSAARLMFGAVTLFTNWVKMFKNRPNELPPFDPAISMSAHGDPNIFYYHGYWQLQPDEALIVEVTPPECDYWNFQLCNHWMESLDYRYHRISINKASAKLREDGSVRIIVSSLNPNLDNWLDTEGHSFGTMCLRWVRASSHPQPQTKVVKISEIE